MDFKIGGRATVSTSDDSVRFAGTIVEIYDLRNGKRIAEISLDDGGVTRDYVENLQHETK